MVRLKAINRDIFESLKEAKQNFRKFQTQQRRNTRSLAEASDLLNAWQAVADCGPKTAKYINELKADLIKRYNELNIKKDDILT